MINKIVLISTGCVKYNIKSALNISKYDRVKICIYDKKSNVITCGVDKYNILTPTPDKLGKLDEDIYIFISNSATEKTEHSLEQGIQSVLENVIVNIKKIPLYEHLGKIDSNIFEIIQNKDFTTKLEYVDPVSATIPKEYSYKDPFTGMYSFWSRGKKDEATKAASTNIRDLIPDYDQKKQLILLFSLQHSALTIDRYSYLPSVTLSSIAILVMNEMGSAIFFGVDPAYGYTYGFIKAMLNTLSFLTNITEDFIEFYTLNQLGEVISKVTITKKDPAFITLKSITQYSMAYTPNTIFFLGQNYQTDRVSGAFTDQRLYSFDTPSEENVKKVLKDFARTKLNKAYNQRDYDHIFNSIPAVEYQQPEDNNTMYKATFDTKVKTSNPVDTLEITNKVIEVDNINLFSVFNVRYYQMLFGCRMKLSGKAKYLFHIPEKKPNLYIHRKEKRFLDTSLVSIPFCYSGNLIIDISDMELEALFYNDKPHQKEEWTGKVPLVIYDSVFILRDMEQFDKLFVKMKNYSYKPIVLKGCSFYIKEINETIYRTIINEGNKVWSTDGVVSHIVGSYYTDSYLANRIPEYSCQFNTGFGGDYGNGKKSLALNTLIRVKNNGEEVKFTMFYILNVHIKDGKVIIKKKSDVLEYAIGNGEFIDIGLYSEIENPSKASTYVFVNNDVRKIEGMVIGSTIRKKTEKFKIEKGAEFIHSVVEDYIPMYIYIENQHGMVDFNADTKQLDDTVHKLIDYSNFNFVEYDFAHYFTENHSDDQLEGKGVK